MTAETAVTAVPAMVPAVVAPLVTGGTTMVADGHAEMAGGTAVPGGMLPAGRRHRGIDVLAG